MTDALTVAEFAADWPTLFPRPDDRTNRNNVAGIAHFARVFGDCELGKLTRANVWEWASENPSKVRFARSMYADATNAGLVPANPFEGLRVNGGQSVGRRYADLPTEDEIYALEQVIDPKLVGMVAFASMTGMRLGEQLGLRAVDFEPPDGSTVWLETQIDPSGVRRPLKGASAGRRVFIPPHAHEVVRELLLVSQGRLWDVSRRGFYSAWGAAREEVGVEWPWHMLRHYAASTMLERGAQTRDVAYMLGHANDDEVRRRYGRHVDDHGVIDRMRELE